MRVCQTEVAKASSVVQWGVTVVILCVDARGLRRHNIDGRTDGKDQSTVLE